MTGWEATLFWSLLASAVLAFGYRVFRLSKGGPMADVVGGGVLGVLLIVLAIFTAQGAGWARWPALFYALLFGLLVMPVWTLAVYVPSRPGALDHVLVGLYWLSLVATGVAAVAL